MLARCNNCDFLQFSNFMRRLLTLKGAACFSATISTGLLKFGVTQMCQSVSVWATRAAQHDSGSGCLHRYSLQATPYDQSQSRATRSKVIGSPWASLESCFTTHCRPTEIALVRLLRRIHSEVDILRRCARWHPHRASICRTRRMTRSWSTSPCAAIAEPTCPTERPCSHALRELPCTHSSVSPTARLLVFEASAPALDGFQRLWSRHHFWRVSWITLLARSMILSV